MNSRITLVSGVILCFCLPLVSQTPVLSSGFPALSYAHPVQHRGAAWNVEYLNYAGEPAFRIKVHHYHAWCNGYLYFTPTRIAFDPSLTPWTKDGVVISRSDVSAITPRSSGIEIAWPNALQRFAFLTSPENLSASTPDRREQMMQFLTLVAKDFSIAQQQFFRAIAGLPPGTAAVSQTPVVNILLPSGASARATVFSREPDLHVYGIASAASGIRTVAVNGNPAKINSLSSQIVLFESGPSPMSAQSLPVSITADANDTSQTAVTFNVLKPEILVSDPQIGQSTADAAINVRGSVFGFKGIQGIKVANTNAVLTQRADGGINFEAKVPLEMGPNVVPGIITLADGQDVTFFTEARRSPPGPPPMTLPSILQGLRLHVDQKLIISAIDQKGVDFALTEESERLLRAEGAKDSLLQAIEQARRQ